MQNNTTTKPLKQNKMNKANRDKLKALELEQMKIKYPSMREELLALTEWKDNSANNLTKCIIFWIKAMGGQAERISNQGQYRAGKSIEIASGMKQMPGKWTPGQGTKGTADISATIRGRSVKIEVKHGNDRQSEYQKHIKLMLKELEEFTISPKILTLLCCGMKSFHYICKN
jgi:hypothetical protein